MLVDSGFSRYFLTVSFPKYDFLRSKIRESQYPIFFSEWLQVHSNTIHILGNNFVIWVILRLNGKSVRFY